MRKKQTISPWQRWCIIVTVVSPDRRTAEKRLQLPSRQLSVLLKQAMETLEVTTVMHAALKLGLIKVDYDQLGDWFEKQSYQIVPGIELDLEA